MVQTSSPVDGNIAFLAIQSRGTLHGSTSADATELEQAVKDRAVVSYIVLALLLGKLFNVVGSDFLEKVDIFVSVELGHFEFGGRFGTLLVVSFCLL